MKAQIDRMFTWFSNLSTLIKVGSSFIIFVTWIGATVTLYNNYIIKNHDNHLTEKIDTVLSNQDRFAVRIDNLESTQTDWFGTLVPFVDSYNHLQASVKTTWQANPTMTKEQYAKLTEGINTLIILIKDEKKKSGQTSMIAPYMIQ